MSSFHSTTNKQKLFENVYVFTRKIKIKFSIFSRLPVLAQRDGLVAPGSEGARRHPVQVCFSSLRNCRKTAKVISLIV
jgi:hypothetical protein